MPNYTFHTSHDATAIRDCMLQHHNIPAQFISGAESESWEPEFNDKTMYISVKAGVVLHGFFVLLRKDVHIAEAHMIFYRSAWGQVAEMGRQCLRWIWTNFPFITMLAAPVKVGNRLAERCIRKMGFTDTKIVVAGYKRFYYSKL